MTDTMVQDYLDGVSPAKRRRDAETLLQLMARITGLQPALSGTIVGFGQYHYRYESGREGDAFAACFAPRKAALSIYLPDGIGRHAELLSRLGPHRTGVGCLYINDLEKIDPAVLEAIISSSYANVTAGTFTERAREGRGVQ